MPAAPPTGPDGPAAPDPAAPARAAAAQAMRVLPGAMDGLRRAMRAQLDGPLTVPQFRGLNFVDRHPGSSVGALAAFLGVTPATASAMVERLVRAGYLRSQGSASDRRRAELSLCDAGREVLGRLRGRVLDRLSGALQGCSAEELQALRDGLRVLDGAFARLDAGADAAPAAAATTAPAPARPQRAAPRSKPAQENTP